MQILVDGGGTSFRKVATTTARGLYECGLRSIRVVDINAPLGFNPFSETVIVGDLVLVQRLISRYAFYDRVVLWADTPLYVDSMDVECCVYVCLSYWMNEYRGRGLPVHGWIPRPIDFDLARSVTSADCKDLVKRFGDYVVTVASDVTIFVPRPPRKGLDMFDRLCGDLRSRGMNCVAVTNWSLRNAHTIRSGTLDDYDLLRLVKCARLFVWASRSEGFGIPPIEAMAVGQVVVSSNAPFNELVVGVKFDYRDVKHVWYPGLPYRYVCWDYDYRDLIDAVEYALDMPEQERDKLVESGMSIAKTMDKFLVAQSLLRVMY